MNWADFLQDAGRVIFGAFFLIAGIRNFARFSKHRAGLTNYGWGLHSLLLVAAFVLQLTAGAAIILDIGTVWASLALIVFLVAATALYHNPLRFPSGERDLHIYLVLVNTMLVGVLLMLIGQSMVSGT